MAQATFGLYVWELYTPCPSLVPACFLHSIDTVHCTGVLVKQIPARLQSQHCKQFDQTLYGCTCKKEIENIPFANYPTPTPSPTAALCYRRICVGIPHMTVYLTVYMSWRTASTSVCTYRLLIRRVVPKCWKKWKKRIEKKRIEHEMEKQWKWKCAQKLNQIAKLRNQRQQQQSHTFSQSRNPLTLIASPQTHKQFICHTHTHTDALTHRQCNLPARSKSKFWSASDLHFLRHFFFVFFFKHFLYFCRRFVNILLTVVEIYHVNLWEMLI